MKDIERLIQQLSKVDPKVKIYDNFGHSHPLKSSERNYFYFFFCYGWIQTLFPDYWKFSKNRKILWSFYLASQMTRTDEFWVRRRILEPRYRLMKCSNFKVGQLPLKIIFYRTFFVSCLTLKVTGIQFSWKKYPWIRQVRENSIWRTSAILEHVIFNFITNGFISNWNFSANSKQ